MEWLNNHYLFYFWTGIAAASGKPSLARSTVSAQLSRFKKYGSKTFSARGVKS